MKIIDFFKTGDERSVMMKKNILFSFCLKGFSIFVSFILVPLTLGYLNEYEYGIWLTLNSVLSWIYIFDIGLGNGLRNKLAEALAHNNKNLAKNYVSTSFFGMIIVGLAIFITYFLCNNFIDWYSIFNVEFSLVPNLPEIISIVVGIVCIIFVFKLVGNIYMALQMPVINDLMTFCGSLLSLIIIYILTKTTSGSLKDIALTFTSSSAIVYIIAFIITIVRNKELTPSYKFVKLAYFKDLMSLGTSFMIIQIAVIVIFMSSNLIISNLFGPSEVTPYNIVFKYFSIITMAFTIIITPLWSAITDAKERKDIKWIQDIHKKMLKIWLAFCLILILMIFVSNIFYKIWIGNKILIPLSISIWMGIYTAITTFTNLYANIINGFGKIRIQLIYAIIQAIIYIPFAIFCGKKMGVIGILVGSCAVCFIGAFFNCYQTKKLINGTAIGIWNK